MNMYGSHMGIPYGSMNPPYSHLQQVGLPNQVMGNNMTVPHNNIPPMSVSG